MSKQIRKIENIYVPSDTLVEFLNDKIRVVRGMKKLKTAGRDERESITKREQPCSIARRKVDIFDRHLFRSMASLTYFFEFLNQYPELIVDFENEIEELFGFKGAHVLNKQNDDSKYIVFERFIKAILNVRFIKNLNDEPAFRSYLINILQEELLTKVEMIGRIKETELYDNLILYDFARCRAWIKYLIRDVESPSTTNPHRLANF